MPARQKGVLQVLCQVGIVVDTVHKAVVKLVVILKHHLHVIVPVVAVAPGFAVGSVVVVTVAVP